MPGQVFHFKRFTVHQDQCAMKVGTDAIVFGAWVGYTGFKRILDIGTGTGVLALIAAQRNAQAQVHAVEIDPDAAVQATANAAASPWAGRIRVHHMDVRRMRADEPFDLVLCNPPYYDGQAASPSARDRVARHSADLDFAELLSAVDRLLGPRGRFSVILPADRERAFEELACGHGLYPSRRCLLRYVNTRPPKRVMLDLARYQGPVIAWELQVSGDDPRSFTPETARLVADLLDR